MTFEEIEKALGAKVVANLRSAVEAALLEAGKLASPEAGTEMVGELLIAMLAAVVIIPKEGAETRAEATADRLLAIVREALANPSGH